MKLLRGVVDELRVNPGDPAALATRSTAGTVTDWLGPIGRANAKDVAERDLEAFKTELETAQELLYASDTWALLLVFQALDAAGKDGTIKHVMSGVDPQGCEVWSFKAPSSEELRHDYLWRCGKALPERGRIGIFNRSYYEEVLSSGSTQSCSVHNIFRRTSRMDLGYGTSATRTSTPSSATWRATGRES